MSPLLHKNNEGKLNPFKNSCGKCTYFYIVNKLVGEKNDLMRTLDFIWQLGGFSYFFFVFASMMFHTSFSLEKKVWLNKLFVKGSEFNYLNS